MSEPAVSALGTEIQRMLRAVDNVLVAAHTLNAQLGEDHLPFSATLADGVAKYGADPLFGVWVVCRAVDALRTVCVVRPAPVMPTATATVVEET